MFSHLLVVLQAKLVASCRCSIDVVKHVRSKLEQTVGLSTIGESAAHAEGKHFS